MSSISETAERICRHNLDSERVSVTQFSDIQAAIEKALRDERERAAKILEKRVADLKSVTHPTTHNTSEQLDLADLITKIRKGTEP